MASRWGRAMAQESPKIQNRIFYGVLGFATISTGLLGVGVGCDCGGYTGVHHNQNVGFGGGFVGYELCVWAVGPNCHFFG